MVANVTVGCNIIIEQCTIGCCKVLGMSASTISRWSNKLYLAAKWGFPGAVLQWPD